MYGVPRNACRTTDFETGHFRADSGQSIHSTSQAKNQRLKGDQGGYARGGYSVGDVRVLNPQAWHAI